jgi:glycosyltransferase involved in cell wall biosynthesis
LTPKGRHRTETLFNDGENRGFASPSGLTARSARQSKQADYRNVMRKRLVVFSPGHAEPGGAAARSRALARILAERGWDVRVVTRAGSLNRFRLERSPNLTVLEVPGFTRRRLGGAVFLVVAVPAGIVWGVRSTALIAIRLTAPATAAGLCGLLLRRPYLAFTTSSGERSELRHVLSTRTSSLRRWFLRRAAFLVAQSTHAAAELEVLVPPERIAVVPNPVNSVTATPLNGKPHAVYSGRLSAEKDLSRLLSAWSTIVQEQPGAHLTLVGAGGTHRSVEEELRATVELDRHLRGTVTFTGWVADVGECLREADVYVFPSLEEGMSNALLEACAWRRVIVASDIPANRAVLGDDFPLLFKAGDTESLIAALRRAFSNKSVRAEAVRRVEARIRGSSRQAVGQQLEQLVDAARRSRRG